MLLCDDDRAYRHDGNSDDNANHGGVMRMGAAYMGASVCVCSPLVITRCRRCAAFPKRARGSIASFCMRVCVTLGAYR